MTNIWLVAALECSKYYAHWFTNSATGYLTFSDVESERHVPKVCMGMCMLKQQKIFWKSSLTLYFTATLIHLHNISLGHSHVYVHNATCVAQLRERERERERERGRQTERERYRQTDRQTDWERDYFSSMSLQRFRRFVWHENFCSCWFQLQYRLLLYPSTNRVFLQHKMWNERKN